MWDYTSSFDNNYIYLSARQNETLTNNFLALKLNYFKNVRRGYTCIIRTSK